MPGAIHCTWHEWSLMNVLRLHVTVRKCAVHLNAACALRFIHPVHCAYPALAWYTTSAASAGSISVSIGRDCWRLFSIMMHPVVWCWTSQEIVAETKIKLRDVSKNPATYKKLLQDLLVQGLKKLGEKTATVKCRQVCTGIVACNHVKPADNFATQNSQPCCGAYVARAAYVHAGCVY